MAVPLVPRARRGWGLRRPLRTLVPALATAGLVAALAWSYVQPIRPGWSRFQWPPWTKDVGADIREADHGRRSFPLAAGQEAHEAEQTLAAIDSISSPATASSSGPTTSSFYDDTYLYRLTSSPPPTTSR